MQGLPCGAEIGGELRPFAALRPLLHPELVHPGKGGGVLVLEGIPARQVGHSPVLWESRHIPPLYGLIEIEPDEGEAVLRDEVGDLRNREAVLLHVEQQVAAAAYAEKVSRRGDRLELAVAVEERLPAAANVFGRRPITPLGDEGVRPGDMRACDLAVEADRHETAGPQQGEQHPPPGSRIGEMVKYARRFDEIEAPSERPKFEDIRLAILDIAPAELMGLALGIG